MRQAIVQVALAVDAHLATFQVLDGMNIRPSHHHVRQAYQRSGDDRRIDAGGEAWNGGCRGAEQEVYLARLQRRQGSL
jgi:hypothetical protein